MNRRLAVALAALLLGACGGADTPSKHRTTPGDSDEADSASDDDEVPRKHRKKKRAAQASEDDEDATEGEDDAGGDDVEEVEMSAKDREREERRSRDRAKLRREMGKGDAGSRRGKTGVFGARTDDEDADTDDSDDEERPARKKAAAKRTPSADDESDDEERPTRKKAAPKQTATDDDSADAGSEDDDEAAREQERDERKKRDAARAKKEAAEHEREQAAARKQQELQEERAAAERKKEEAAAKKREEAERRQAEAERKKEEAAAKKREAAERKQAEADRKKEEAAAKKREAAAKRKAPPTDDSDDDDEDDDDESGAKTADVDMTGGTESAPQPPRAKTAATHAADDDDDGESDEEDDKPLDLDRIEEEDPLAQKRVAAVSPDGDDSTSDAPESPAKTALAPLDARPLTLHKGGADVHGGMRIAKITFPGDMDTPSLSKTSEAFVLGGSYGVTDKLEVGGDYALSINPGTVKGPLTLRAAYSLAHGKLDVALAGGFAFDFYETTNDVTMMTSSTTYMSLQLGGWVRYHATSTLSLFTGSPGLPNASVGLSQLALPLPPFQYQLSLGLNADTPMVLELPVGASLQASRSLYAFASLNVANISLKSSKNAYAFSDFIPLSLGAFYTLGKADVGFQGGADLKQSLDYLRLDLVLRYYLK